MQNQTLDELKRPANEVFAEAQKASDEARIREAREMNRQALEPRSR